VEVVGSGFESAWSLWLGWPARLVLLATCAFLFGVNWRRLAAAQWRLLAMAGALAALAIAILLPPGASAALILLGLAYTVGSRSLAVIGVLAEIYFIWMFYDDLGSTLLAKSIMLMAAGSALLVCYGLLIQAARQGRPA
jgi:uncharacterized membrane protein